MTTVETTPVPGEGQPNQIPTTVDVLDAGEPTPIRLPEYEVVKAKEPEVHQEVVAEVQQPQKPQEVPVTPEQQMLQEIFDHLPDEGEESSEMPPPEPNFVKENSLHQYSTTIEGQGGSPDTLCLPPATEQDIKNRLSKLPNSDLTQSENQRDWIQTLKASLSYIPMRGMYVDSLFREGSKYSQSVDYQGQTLRGVTPTFKTGPGSVEVEGERAVLQIMTHLGVGGLFRAPLWHTGLWVTFKPATDTEFVEFNRMIAEDKIQLGRWSYGLALSNQTVYMKDRVFEFVLQHVYNTSVRAEELPISELRKYIAPQDIDSFIWGFLSACYPSGFHYETACIQDPSKCSQVIKGLLNVTKLQNVDTAVLTDWQKQHMLSMSANSKSLESLKRYREELSIMADRRVVFNKGSKTEIAITLSVPTVVQYIEEGYRWIGGLVDSVTQVLGKDSSIRDRNSEINRLSKATILRQYGHWVKKIEFGELSDNGTDPDQRSVRYIVSKETIENTLNGFSMIDSLREGITDEVKKFVNESTFSLIGVPAFDCPRCHTPQEGDPKYPRMKSVIPLDLLQVFFGLLSQRLDRIESL